jgi:hypothetical protein
MKAKIEAVVKPQNVASQKEEIRMTVVPVPQVSTRIRNLAD